jgi:hypothetical protein
MTLRLHVGQTKVFELLRLALRFGFAVAAICAILGVNPLWGQNTFPATGNVGIGTTSPQALLHAINSSASAQGVIRVDSISPTTATYFGAYNDVGNAAIFGIYGSAATVESIGLGEASVYTTTPALDLTAGASNGVIKFLTNGFTERARIAANGNVGIGTTTPGSALHVYGGAGTRLSIQSSTGDLWRIGDGVGAGNGTFVIYDYTKSRPPRIIAMPAVGSSIQGAM